jgi:hypothetical protein
MGSSKLRDKINELFGLYFKVAKESLRVKEAKDAEQATLKSQAAKAEAEKAALELQAAKAEAEKVALELQTIKAAISAREKLELEKRIHENYHSNEELLKSVSFLSVMQDCSPVLLQFLILKDIVPLSLSCRFLNQIMNGDTIWNSLIEHDFPKKCDQPRLNQLSSKMIYKSLKFHKEERQVFVRSFYGQTMTINIKKKATVGELCNKIAERLSIPVRDLTLTYGGTLLMFNSTKTIKKAKIRNEVMISASVKLRGD